MYLLDDVELFFFRGEIDGYAIAEYSEDRGVDVFLFTQAGEPIEHSVITCTSKDTMERDVCKYIESYINATECRRLSIFDKLNFMINFSSAVIIVREREETRGGEIAELIYGILLCSGNRSCLDKFCLFKKEGFNLSSMIMEFLDYCNICIRTYRFKDDLIKSVLRYLSYRLR